MFKRLDSTDPAPIDIEVDGQWVTARAGDSSAAALLVAGCVPLRHTPISGAPRAPLCLMGVCFECLVEVDDTPNVQACLVSVRAGMRIRTHHEARRVRVDDAV